ncbi:sulfide/dihydroorotate dehydrogenase-like FAD/NAD-binding protein [Dehalogenimonas alkenigignens]|uniref:sulfide/dihydroorotate dehydrogenase-like FAD/NAD-binding protein n=1 Tax=Dehalogenimonas alkenigignens TaxID=1217799 RepID=UPI000D56A041|nr:sulfide/dihydroorotate dehydrogenase-like FAD/NAD-binding protein [Dehalogenimonas alkenigignens]PVV83981.1 sulfide/dihydroorotate dehydrogenase-like FAD/NAD-binding protein [Dehalogenimonas alkenigignens]
MFPIVATEELVPRVRLYRIHAPRVARKAAAGQFVILRVDAHGERIPLTIADWDAAEGTVSVVFMEVGTTTTRLARLKPGDVIADLCGPLGNPTEVENFGTVCLMAGGFATATIMPIARAMKAAGNRVIIVVGARNKDLLFWRDRLAENSDELIITTDDGSAGRKGVVTEPVKEKLERGERIDRVIAIGPSIMMKFSSLTTKPFGVKTIVSMNPIMVDGTGMCGCCRVSVAGQTRFACVDGPEFDAHAIDWDNFMARQRTYIDEEKRSLEICRCPTA